MQQFPNLVHLLHKGVDLLLPIAQITPLHEMLELPPMEPTSRIAQLEWPQEIARLLEVRANGIDLVDQVLHAHNAKFAKVLLDDGVVAERDALLGDFAIPTLVDELANGLERGVAVGNVGLHDLDHLHGWLGEADEDAIVDLEETEELEDLAGLWRNLVDTARQS